MPKQNLSPEVEKKLAEHCWAAMDGCNVCGIMNAFAEALSQMTSAGLDEHQKRKHPITLLYYDKLRELAYHPDETEVLNAYREVQKMFKGGPEIITTDG